MQYECYNFSDDIDVCNELCKTFKKGLCGHAYEVMERGIAFTDVLEFSEACEAYPLKAKEFHDLMKERMLCNKKRITVEEFEKLKNSDRESEQSLCKISEGVTVDLTKLKRADGGWDLFMYFVSRVTNNGNVEILGGRMYQLDKKYVGDMDIEATYDILKSMYGEVDVI